MAEASSVLGPIRSNHLQTHRLFVVDPHQNTKMSVHFERGHSANSWQISQILQVLKRSVEQSLSTKYVQPITGNDRGTLRNFNRNFHAGV